MVSVPCLSRGVDWLIRLSADNGTFKTQQEIADCMEVSWAGESVSHTAITAEVKMLLDTYLPGSEPKWEVDIERLFLDLKLMQYWDEQTLEEEVLKHQLKRRRRSVKTSSVKPKTKPVIVKQERLYTAILSMRMILT